MIQKGQNQSLEICVNCLGLYGLFGTQSKVVRFGGVQYLVRSQGGSSISFGVSLRIVVRGISDVFIFIIAFDVRVRKMFRRRLYFVYEEGGESGEGRWVSSVFCNSFFQGVFVLRFFCWGKGRFFGDICQEGCLRFLLQYCLCYFIYLGFQGFDNGKVGLGERRFWVDRFLLRGICR